MEIEKHPYGLKPRGNGLLQKQDRNLGILSLLSDQKISILFEYFDAIILSKLFQCSRSLFGFSSISDLWLRLLLKEYNNSQIKYTGTWRETYLKYKGQSKSIHLSNILNNYYSDFLYQNWLLAKMKIKSQYISKNNLKIIFNESELEIYQYRNEPVILKKGICGWKGFKRWNEDYLSNLFQSKGLQCGPCKMTIQEFYNYMKNNDDEAPLFIFDKNFVDLSEAILDDFDVPQCFSENYFSLLNVQPDYRWLIIGGTKSASKWHIDPNGTHAWNALVKGRKKWMFMPPHIIPPGIYPNSDNSHVIQPISLLEWFINFYDDCKNIKGFREGIAQEGDLVFVPSGWWHAVLNLDNENIAITQNFVNKSNLEKVMKFFENSKNISGIDEKDVEIFIEEFREKTCTLRKRSVEEIEVNFWDNIRGKSKICISG